MSDSSLLREAFKVRIGDYLSEHEIEGLGVSADWFLYLSPTIAPALATCFTQFNTYKLLACPCCGGTATIIGTYPTNEFSAICRDCGLETAHKLTPKDAASNWNKRHAPDEGPAGIKTPEPNQMDAMLTDKPQNATIVPCDVCRQPNRIGHDCTPPESGGQGEYVRHLGGGLLALYRGDEQVREIGITPGWNFRDRDEFITRYNALTQGGGNGR